MIFLKALNQKPNPEPERGRGQLGRKVQTKSSRPMKRRWRQPALNGSQMTNGDLGLECSRLGECLDIRRLLTLWRQTHPSILFLSETKNSESRVKKKLKSRLQLNNFVFVNPVGCSRGLVMAWINTLIGKVILANHFYIIVEFCFPNDIIMTVVGVYLSCDFHTRS
ncbi:hypothetical protein LINGRAHAP2_LOCUS9288, partial [Linum grandiflorum]